MSLTSNKTRQRLILDGGVREVIVSASTGTTIPEHGAHVIGAGTHSLQDPTVAGARVTLILNSSDAIVQTASSGVTIGSTADVITATTSVDGPIAVDLISVSTSQWAVTPPGALNVLGTTDGSQYATLTATTR